MHLETINKLYLELSQVATAKTARELDLLRRMEVAEQMAYKLCIQIEETGASPALTECSVQASALREFLKP